MLQKKINTCQEGHQSETSDYCSVCGDEMPQDKASPPSQQVSLVVGGAGGASQGGDAPESCPDCKAPCEKAGQVFCEICCYNFKTGKSGPPVSPDDVSGEEDASYVADGIDGQEEPAHAAEPAPVPIQAAEGKGKAVQLGAAQVTELPPEGLSAADIGDSAPGSQGEQSAPGNTESRAASASAPWEVVVSVDASRCQGTEVQEAPPSQPDRKLSLFRGETLLGRAAGQLAIAWDPGVSRQHLAMTVKEDGALYLRDIGSTNGTTVNGQEAPRGIEVQLADGDVITIGGWTQILVKRRTS